MKIRYQPRGLTARLIVLLPIAACGLFGQSRGYWDSWFEVCQQSVQRMARLDPVERTLHLPSGRPFSAGCETCASQGDSMTWRFGAEGDEARAIRLHSSATLPSEICRAIEESAQPPGTVSCTGGEIEVRRPGDGVSPVDLLFGSPSFSRGWTAEWAVTIDAVPNNDNLVFTPELVLEEDPFDPFEFRIELINPRGSLPNREAKFGLRVEIVSGEDDCPFLSGEIDELEVSSPVTGGRVAAFVSGPGGNGDCVVRALFRGEGGKVEVSNLEASADSDSLEGIAASRFNLSSMVSSSPNGSLCYTEIATFASGRAAFLGTPSQMSPHSDRETLPSEATIAIPVQAWITAQPSAGDDARAWKREREARLRDQVRYANHILEQNLAGIRLDLRFPVEILGPSKAQQVGENCDRPFWTQKSLFRKGEQTGSWVSQIIRPSEGRGVLNIYVVKGGSSDRSVGETGGYACVRENPNVILLGSKAPIDTLVHEVGHHLGLTPPQPAGHTNQCLTGGNFGPCNGFGSVNVMWSQDHEILRDQFSLGQIYRMNFHVNSTLFANGLRPPHQARMCPPATDGCFGCPALTRNTYTGASRSEGTPSGTDPLAALQPASPAAERGESSRRKTLEAALRQVFEAIGPIPGGSQTFEEFLDRHRF